MMDSAWVAGCAAGEVIAAPGLADGAGRRFAGNAAGVAGIALSTAGGLTGAGGAVFAGTPCTGLDDSTGLEVCTGLLAESAGALAAPDAAWIPGLMRGGNFRAGAVAGIVAGAGVGAVVLAVSAGAGVAAVAGLAAGAAGVVVVVGVMTGAGVAASVAGLATSSPAAHPVVACSSSVTRIGIANGCFIIFNIFSIPEIGFITGRLAASALIDMPSIIGK